MKAAEDTYAYVQVTKKITEAQYARCPTCVEWLGSQYWSLSKSVAMHKRGTGHPVTLYRLRGDTR